MTAQLELHPLRSQRLVILHALRDGPLTSALAWQKYGCSRLAAVIIRLRREGHRITTRMIDVPTRNGGMAHVAQYTLEAQ